MVSRAQRILELGGQAPGRMELVRISPEKARAYAEDLFKRYHRDLDKEIPNFDHNFRMAQQKASMGRTQRKDMPVISDYQVKLFQQRLQKGFIDVKRPFSDFTQDHHDPYPQGLSGKDAEKWLNAGLKKYDGDKQDDVVRTQMTKLPVGQLKPIQQQVYFDKSIDNTAKSGASGTRSFLTSSKNIFVVSADGYIIDGHHRFLSGVLLDPAIQVNCLQIFLPIRELLPLSLAFSDAQGNRRNA